MSDETTIPTTASALKTKLASKNKKPVPKTESTPKGKPAAETKTNGLRKPQIRILLCLNKSAKPLTRSQLAEKAPVDAASCVEYLGSHDADIRKANDTKHFPSLLSLGYVKIEEEEQDGRSIMVYSISANGRKILSKIG